MVDYYATNPGPIDDAVLYDQDKHVSSAIWEGQERSALRCHEHTSKLDQWMLTEKQIELVKKAGFGYLRMIPAISLDNPLISALVERWRRETNTFHFTVGEMTVTLEDVAYLLGLPVDGEAVIGVTYTSCEAVCIRLLGKAPDSGYTSGGMVKLSWLKETFSQCPEDASMEDVERHTRAYLLYLVGSTIFSTTTGNKVPVMYLPLFENFDEAGRYAWGAAALSFLYRALGNASLRSQSTISGCLTLLQCWSYYHLNVGRPKLNHDPIHECFPFVLRWKGKQSSPTSNRDVAFYRKALDSMKPSDVDWCPYSNISHTVIPEHILRSLILGRSKTMLICYDKAERHLPDRCLRQFGMHQTVPEEVQKWERKSRGVDGGVDLSTKMDSELNEWSNRHLYIVEAEEDVEESEYMQWYLRITRKLATVLIGQTPKLCLHLSRLPFSHFLQRPIFPFLLQSFIPLSSRPNYKSPGMADGQGSSRSPASPNGGGSHESGGDQSPRSNVREQDRFLPIANISRIMKKALPANGKIAKDAKETVQECVSEFISFITSEASDKCQREKRKTINGDDLLWAMATLGFEDYIEPLKVYLARYREMEGDTKGSAKTADGSAKRDGMQPSPSSQLAHQGSFSQGMNYGNSQGQHMMVPMQGTE